MGWSMSLLPQSASTSQTLALDPQGVDSLRRTARRDQQAGAQAVAKQFEALLFQQMLKSMRDANQSFAAESSSATNLFSSMQDQQNAQLMAMQGHTGLTDAIVRQINLQQAASPSRLSDVQKELTLPVTGRAATTGIGAAKPAASSSGDFLSQLSGEAEQAAADLGVSSKLILAHAALESGWGSKSIKSTDGTDSHNLFGIKSGKDWKGKTVDVLTTEFVDGKAQKQVEKFRAYDSYADAFGDYANLLKRRYGAALGQGADSQGFGRALQSGGYATDPNYASKIARVAESVSARLAARQTGSSGLA